MKHIIALFLVILIASCGKERTIQISAKSAATGQPYGGLHYVVGYSTTTGNGEKSHTVHSGNLDDNGLATVSVRVKRNRTYYVHVDEPENTCYNKFITMYFNSPSDEDGHFNFEFAECGNLQIVIKNTQCFDSSDELKIFRTHSISGFYNNVPNPAIYTGCVDITGNLNKGPIGWYKFEGTVTKDGIITPIKDSIFLGVNETKIWNILY